MIPILYNSTETSFTSNGMGRLKEAIECYVDEERNGIYEAYLTYPVTGKHYAELVAGNILGLVHDETGDIQPFDIYKTKKDMKGTIAVYARHISYRLSRYVVLPMTAGSCAEALATIPNYITPDSCPFTFWTDKSVTATFTVDVPVSVRSILGGTSGSILDTFGTAEYEWDKWTVKLHQHRGDDTGVVIRYGKNLSTLTQELDDSGTYSAVVPYWTNPETGDVVMLPEYIVTTDKVDSTLAIPLDTSEYFDTEPTEAQLRARAESYLANNEGWLANENIKIDFVQLWQTEEYKDVAPLLRLKLCDKIDVYHPGLGITVSNVRIIKVRYNVLTERYDKMELGTPKTNLADTIKEATEDEIMKIVPSKSMMQSAIGNATSLITGGLGGNVVFTMDGDGHPTEFLIMDTDDTSTAVNVIRMNMGGIGFSSDGYNGTYLTAWTIDGGFVADYITAGTLDASLIRAGVIADLAGKNSWNLETGEFTTELGTYIRLGNNGELIFGEADNPLTLALTNDRISFYNGLVEVAYISDNKQYIGNLEVSTSAVLTGLKIYKENGHIYIEPEVNE